MPQTRPVVFAGENPVLTLYRPDGDQAVAGASLWRCTFSEEGAGYALILWADPANSGLDDRTITGIYADNVELARMVWTNFNQHFGSFQNRGIESVAPRAARFVEDAGGRRYHRITCSSGTRTIELLWQDVQDVFHNASTATYGGTTWQITNVVCPCAWGSIVVDGTPVAGEVRQTGGSFQSSAFLAFCESWVSGS
jgi:hypothetical protein